MYLNELLSFFMQFLDVLEILGFHTGIPERRLQASLKGFRWSSKMVLRTSIDSVLCYEVPEILERVQGFLIGSRSPQGYPRGS